MSSAIDQLLAGVRQSQRPGAGQDARPRMALAVLTCMDTRIDPASLLDLGPGAAHVLRNGGGVVTPDVLESLAMSQEHFGTREVVVVQHTQCAARADRFPNRSPEDSVRLAVDRLRAAPELLHRDAVRGFMLDIVRGTFAQVSPSLAPSAVGPAGEANAGRIPPGSPLSRCLWCRRSFDPAASSRRRLRRSYCGDVCRLAARAGSPAPPATHL